MVKKEMIVRKDSDDDKENEKIRLQVLSNLNRGNREDKEYATEILVKKILNESHIYTTKTDKIPEMFIYKEGIYVEEGESETKIMIREIMEENYSDFLAQQVLDKIKIDTFIEPKILFEEKNPYEIAVKNGILNLKEKKIYSFSPKKIFFSKIPVTYNEKSKVDKIDKFLSDILSCPEDKLVLYEVAGMGLIKEYLMEKAIMMVGNGRNGKSKLIELLKQFIGSENCSSVPLSALSIDSPFLQSLWKKHLNLAGDIHASDLKETATFKGVTGRDTISANRKYKNTIQFVNYATLIFSCNELPRVYDYSDGFWERWILLEFPFHFVDENIYNAEKDKKNIKIKDPEIINKIINDQEMSGLLNEAIEGLHRLMTNKKFSYTWGTAEVKNKWIRKSDSFMAFCMDCLEENFEERISKAEIRSKFSAYCRKHKIRGVGDKSMKITLQEMFGADEGYGFVKNNDRNEHYWAGIKFKDNLQSMIEEQEQPTNQNLPTNQPQPLQNKKIDEKGKQTSL